MNLPFSTGEFFANFGAYNQSVWPAQVGLLALGLILALHLVRSPHPDRRLLAYGLALLWLWMGTVYHLMFFTRINPAAYFFAAAFIGQSALLIAWGHWGPALGRRPRMLSRWASVVVLTYALAVYPVVATIIGHRYPAMPTFGLPCPTIIATLGMVVLLWPAPPWWLLVVPLGWAGIGGSAALTMGAYEDLGLILAAVLLVLSRFSARIDAPPDRRVELTAEKY
jgi:hypothetical protein